MQTAEARAFHATGRLWLRAALSEAELEPIDRIADHPGHPGQRLAPDPAPDPALSPLLHCLTRHFPGQRLTRALAFNKTNDSNWGVPWHQDRVIAVAARHALPGFGQWSLKADTWHCEPPLDVLQAMLFVRLHLDPATPDSGPMEIALGSHLAGPVPADKAQAMAERCPIEPCLAARGDVLVLHMLTLHRSLPAANPATRRTLRVDTSPDALPLPLDWAY